MPGAGQAVEHAGTSAEIARTNWQEGTAGKRIQSKADREALGWGLLAWEDPRRTDGPASPFWARAPMLDGEWGPEAPGRGRFRRSQKQPIPSGAIFCWVTVRVRRDRSGRARRRRMEWDTQGCFTPRAMWLIGSGFRRTIPWVQVNGLRWDRIRRIGHCPLDEKKWGTMSTDPLRSERLRIIPRVSTLELYSIRFRILTWEHDAVSRSVECIRINNLKTISYSSIPTVGRRVVQYAG